MKATVTGCSGYLASEIVWQLLSRGWSVIGTVRSLQRVEKLEHLISMQAQFPSKLELVEADLLRPNSFDDAVSRCDYVFHTASPFAVNVDDVVRDLLEPALNGTRNVLSSVCLHKERIKRVILTSSLAAIRGMTDVPKNGSFFTEEDWNMSSKIEDGGVSSYMASKVIAEREAWKIAQEHGFELAVVNPSFILGPPQLRTRSNGLSGGVSLSFMLKWIESGDNSVARCLADVRDVALAHVLCAENPAATGRFIVSTDCVVSQYQVSQCLTRCMNGAINIVTQSTDEQKLPMPKLCDTGRLRAVLGMQLRSPEDTIVDMARVMIESGMAVPNSQQVH